MGLGFQILKDNGVYGMVGDIGPDLRKKVHTNLTDFSETGIRRGIV